jgi:colanic acid/amylovoran biosynthesis protein
MRVYLSGQSSFENRGCEAIVRSTAALLNGEFKDLDIVVPSAAPEWDASQWAQAASLGVRFSPAYRPLSNRVWVNLQRLPLPAIRRLVWPFGFPLAVKSEIRDSDLVMSVGGDNYSLDYKRPSLLMGMDAFAMAEGVPVVLWGASAGPFERDPEFVPVVLEHLARMKLILVREDISRQYLESLGLRNVTRMVDPAFTLAPEAYDPVGWPVERGGVVGVNLGSLVLRYAGHGAEELLSATAGLCEHIVAQHGLSVALIPHVVPRDVEAPGDHSVSERLARRLAGLGRSIAVVEPTMNAAQTKYVISRCRFFIGARTHATIAGMSSGVPTASIAYSVKAAGINQDVYGHQRWVLDYREASKEGLRALFDALVQHEADVRSHLEGVNPRLARDAIAAAARLRGTLVDG